MLDRLLDAKLSEMDELLNLYVKERHSVVYILDNFSLFNKEKKKMIIKRFYYYHQTKFEKMISSNEDVALMIEYFMEKPEIYVYAASKFMKKLSEPKKYVKDKYIDVIISNTSTDSIIENFNSYFKNEILELKDDYYKLLNVKEELTSEDIVAIYEKTFKFLPECKMLFDHYLNFAEKKEYTKLYLTHNPESYDITHYLIKQRAYDKEDFDKLILLVGCFSSAELIYDVIINEQLTESQEKMLEKALYDTRNIEYIAYYTFYKNKKEFNRLFKSSLLFLGFVKLNEHLFKDKEILEDVIDAIETKKVNYTDNVINKINTTYQIKKGK